MQTCGRPTRSQRAMVAACWCLLTPVSCSFDDYPSLGRQPAPKPPLDLQETKPVESASELPEVPPAASPAPPMNDSRVTAAVAGSGGDAPPTPIAGISAFPPIAPPCDPGTYSVNLRCDVSSRVPFSPPVLASLNAKLTLKMKRAPRDGSLEFSDAQLALPFASPYQAYSISGKLSGALDCQSDTFYAEIADGSYAAFFDWPIVLELSGRIEGRRLRNTQQLTGHWWYGNIDGLTCDGTWDGEPM